MVPVATPSAIVAPSASLSWSVMVSSPSSCESSMTSTETVFSCSLSTNVSVPSALSRK